MERKWIYIILALTGASVTWYFNIRFTIDAGGQFDMLAFMQAAFANHAASSLSTDAIVVAVTFLIWAVAEARRLSMRHWWVYMVLTLFVAVSFAFPVFLAMREKHLMTVNRMA